MRRTQTGVTFIGWLVLLVPVAIVGYAGIRLTPLYLNYLKVVKALEQTASENKGEDQINPAAVRVSMQKHFDIDSIDYPKVENVTVARDGTQWALEANYEDIVPLFAGISLLVHFDKRAVIE
jgi:hypothetical protein